MSSGQVPALVVLEAPDSELLAQLARYRPQSCKVLFRAGGSLDLEALRYWAEVADTVFVADEILAFISSELVRQPRPLSELQGWRPWGASRGTASRAALNGDLRGGAASGPVLFFPTNDTIAKMFLPIAKHVPQYAFATPVKWREERAAEVLAAARVKSVENHPRLLDEISPSVVLFGNDWSSEEIELIQAARARGIPTACLQEGCLDWADAFARLEWVDFPMVQGPVTLRYLPRRFYFATGNPRFDHLRPLPLPTRPRVMINCNFTYGIHEDARADWIRDVVGACRLAGLEFFISQHPRDTARFPGLPVRQSGADVVHQHLADCSVLVTRFSTIVYEAMLLGRPVVYYNPHGERMVTFNADASGGLLKAHDADTLGACLRRASANSEADVGLRAHFIREHCGSADGHAAARCAVALEVIGKAAVLSPDARRPSRNVFAPARRTLSRLAHAILGDHPDA